jgi:hypothetical protein
MHINMNISLDYTSRRNFMQPNFEKTKQFSINYDELFMASLEAIKAFELERIAYDEESGSITAKTSSSLESLGEDIQIQVNRDGNIYGRSESACAFIDWNKNETNITKFWENFYAILEEAEENTFISSVDDEFS